MTREAVVVDGVTKTFRTGRRRLVARRADRAMTVVALDDVSLSVAEGGAIAVVGPNGAGKTTLLRLMAGVGRPDRGSIQINGDLRAFLDLGVGFHADCTGRDSAVLASIVAGSTRKDAERRLPEIIEFSGLSRVIDQPLRTYSTGMKARLAFAVAARDDVGLLVVDEALAVGDLAFRQRCRQRIQELRQQGSGLVLATHELDLAAELCDRAVWLHAGRVVAEGAPAEIQHRYRDEVRRQMVASTPTPSIEPAGPLQLGRNRWGNQEVTVEAFRLFDDAGAETSVISTGAAARVTFDVRAEDARPIHLSVSVLDGNGLVCIDTVTAAEVDAGVQPFEIRFERIELVPGGYWIDVGAYDEAWDQRYDYHHAAHPLEVVGPGGRNGIVIPPIQWRVPIRTTSGPDEEEGERGWRPRSSTSS